MPFERTCFRSRRHIPEQYFAILCHGCERTSILRKRYGADSDVTWQQRQSAGSGPIVQPDADAAGHRERVPVGRNVHRTVPEPYGSSSQPRGRTVGQAPRPVVLLHHLVRRTGRRKTVNQRNKTQSPHQRFPVETRYLHAESLLGCDFGANFNAHHPRWEL